MGIRINILSIFTILFFGAISLVHGSRLSNTVDDALQALGEDYERDEKRFQELTELALDENDYYSLVKCNFVLGFIEEGVHGDYGKAILYYLEGIRYAKHADYDGAKTDLAKMLKNTGMIFSRFNDFENAKDYFEQAMTVAREQSMFDLYGRLMFSMGQLYHENDLHEEALEILNTAFERSEIMPKTEMAKIYNEIGLIYTDLGDLEMALSTFDKLQRFVSSWDNDTSNDKVHLVAQCLHNIGNAYLTAGDYEEALSSYKTALAYEKMNADSTYSNISQNDIFLTLKDLGESALYLGKLELAIGYFEEAQLLVPDIHSDPQVFGLYKLMGRVFQAQGDMITYSQYQDLYSTTLEGYVSAQQEIEASDKQYSLELITNRYFELVAEQERSRQIRQFAQLGGLALIFVIISILGYYQYSRYRLRRDLETALRPYAETVYVE